MSGVTRSYLTRRGEGYREEALDHTLDHTLIIIRLLITELFKALELCPVLCLHRICVCIRVCVYTSMCVFYKIFMKGVGLKGGRGLPGKLTRRRGQGQTRHPPSQVDRDHQGRSCVLWYIFCTEAQKDTPTSGPDIVPGIVYGFLRYRTRYRTQYLGIMGGASQG